MATPINYRTIDDVIKRNLDLFKKPRAMTVRPGYKMTGGWMTDKPSIVVTVDKKLDSIPQKEMLPAEVDNVPVDVREATGLQRLRAADPTAYALAKAHLRPELQEPDWTGERTLPKGEPVKDAVKASVAAVTKASKKPELDYTPPAGVKLDPVQGKMSIIANASPDAGFGVLKSFLKATTRELVIAMYDFTSGEILAEVISAITPPSVKFQMVLDHPPRNPTANQTDQDTFDQIMDLKRDNVAINWALTRNDPAATEWIYPSAYHIKVAVRDGNTVWLSSGNFNVSNQPDLAVDDPKKGSLKNADRDWHLVIENGQLAALFRAYILNDFTAAKPYQSKGDPALHKKIDASLKKLKTEKDKSTFIAQKAVQSGAVTMIKAEPFNNLDIKVQPLLTPDPGQHTTMYVDQILALINSAEKSLYMQTQYVHPSEADADKDFQALILAFSAAHKKGLDVRLITSQYENTGQWMEKLKQYDLDQVLRIQDRVHNKGIVVDSSIVVVSSQNWSSAGVLRNRDAGLIVYNTDIASYFEKLFLSDWVNYAKEKVVDASHTRDKKTVKKRPAKRTPSKKTAKKKAAKKR